MSKISAYFCDFCVTKYLGSLRSKTRASSKRRKKFFRSRRKRRNTQKALQVINNAEDGILQDIVNIEVG